MASSFRDVDRGAARMVLNAAKLPGRKRANHLKLKVGISEDAVYPDGKSVAMVGAVHEFGKGNVPQRSFIRGWYDETGQSAMMGKFRDEGKKVLLGRGDERELLSRAGYWFVRSIKERMLRHIPPPLQKDTVARKERGGADLPDTPLVETHVLIDAIKSWIP